MTASKHFNWNLIGRRTHEHYHVLDSVGQITTSLTSAAKLSVRDNENNLLHGFIEKHGGKMNSTTTSWAASVLEGLESTVAWNDKTTYLEVAREIELRKRK